MKKTILIAFISLTAASFGYSKPDESHPKEQAPENSNEENITSVENYDLNTPDGHAKKILSDLTAAFETSYINLHDSANDEDAAKALTGLINEMVKLSAEGKAFESKYPNFVFSDKNENLKEEYRRLNKAADTWLGMLIKAKFDYRDSEVFNKALEEIDDSMSSAKSGEAQENKQASEKSNEEKKVSLEKNYDLNTPEGQMKKLMNEMAILFETGSSKLKNSIDDREAAEAVKYFCSDMAKLSEEGKALEAKYPEYKVKKMIVLYKEEFRKLQSAMTDFFDEMVLAYRRYGDSEIFKKSVEGMSSSTGLIEEK